jgi:putative spermidine/putrescine transport system permease protein
VRRRQLGRSAGQAVTIAYVALVLLFIVAPTIIVVFVSFHKGQYFIFPPREYSFRWYSEALLRPEWRNAFTLSLGLAVAASAVSTLIGALAALGLYRGHFRAKPALSALFLAPVALPGILTGVALLFFFTRLRIAGSFSGLLIGHVLVTTPYVLRLVLAGLPGMSRTIEEAALVHGADDLTTLRLITLPLLRPAIISGALFAFIVSFDNVMISLFLTNPRLNTLPVKILQAVEWSADPTIAAISTIFILISLALMLVLDRFVGLQFAPTTAPGTRG